MRCGLPVISVKHDGLKDDILIDNFNDINILKKNIENSINNKVIYSSKVSNELIDMYKDLISS